VTPSEGIVAADYGNQRVQAFDGLGNFLFKLGTAGTGDGQFRNPEGVAVTPAGTILVADAFNHRIQGFAAEVPAALALSDNFDDNTRAAKWGFGTIQGAVKTGPSAWDSAIPVLEQNHRLEITPRANASGDHYNGYVSAGTYDFTNLGASVEVVQTASGDITDTDLCLGINSQNFYLIEVEYGKLYFTQVVAGVRTEVSVSYSPSTHRFWRIRHDAASDTILFQTSSNGQSWTTWRTVPRQLALTAMKVELSAGTWKSVSAPGKAIFDNLAVE
jgi:DNA-binding beta-propeller fold protein YncE